MVTPLVAVAPDTPPMLARAESLYLHTPVAAQATNPPAADAPHGHELDARLRELLTFAERAVGSSLFARQVFARFGHVVADAAALVAARVVESNKLPQLLTIDQGKRIAYLSSIARHLAIDLHRENREVVPLEQIVNVATGDARRDPTLPFTTEVERMDLREHIGKEITAFAAGDSRKRISLQARILNGATFREAGAAAGVSEGLVRLWLQAALAPEQPLRRLLRELWETYQE